MNLVALLNGGRNTEDDRPPAELRGDVLVIDCRGCAYRPVPGSSECISCAVRAMCALGGADRVVLRTGRDTEISGRAARVLRECASLMRWSLPRECPGGRCRGCSVSRTEVMGRAWSCFPGRIDPDIRVSLADDVPVGDGCAECAASTVRALEQMEDGIAEITASMKGVGGCRRSP